MDSPAIAAIDAHGHFGAYVREGADPLSEGFMSATAEEVVARAAACGVICTIVSPLSGLVPRGRADVPAANAAAFQTVANLPQLRQYVIVNPLQPRTYEQAREMLLAPWCVGIKLHPEEHGYRIADHGRALFAFLEEVGAPAMAHSGCPNSLPEAYVPFANDHPGVRLLLAHLGNGSGDGQRVDLQVRAAQSARHRNIWIDTSSARSMLPKLIEWAVRECGAERLLFGSDTPLYHVALQRHRIECAEIPVADKEQILFRNALVFFNLELRLPTGGAAESKHA